MATKVTAGFVAVMMVLTVSAMAVADSDSSDAVTTAPWTFQVHDGSGWTTYTVGDGGYNGCIAINKAGIPGLVIDNRYTVTKTNAYGDYITINEEYGRVSKIGDQENGVAGVWNVAFLDSNGTWQNRESWIEITWSGPVEHFTPEALGFYKQYSDYSTATATENDHSTGYRTSAIALWYGADDSSMPAGVPATTNSYITVDSSSQFRAFFLTRVDDGYTPTISPGGHSLPPMVIDGDTYALARGYGSDAYLAMKDALGAANVVGNEVIGENYSWITTIYGLGTQQIAGQDTPNDYTDDKYVYWNQYDGVSLNPPKLIYSGFLTGHHSSVPGAPMGGSVIMMHYKADA
ncbi:hypothetical protein PAA26_02905 [Methanomassiliicoccaceae archaeon COG_1]|nr:hypothetical protein [Methanomassiliicoccaceae archaeon COG_1]